MESPTVNNPKMASLSKKDFHSLIKLEIVAFSFILKIQTDVHVRHELEKTCKERDKETVVVPPPNPTPIRCFTPALLLFIFIIRL